MVVAVVVAVVGVEGEAVDERLAVPGLLGGSRQSPGPQDGLASDGENEKQLKILINDRYFDLSHGLLLDRVVVDSQKAFEEKSNGDCYLGDHTEDEL